MQNDTAIIIGTYNRAHLLERSLNHYFMYHQDYPQLYENPVHIYIYDDGSTDNTKSVCEMMRISCSMPVYYEYLGDKIEWRDSASYLNYGIKKALKAGYKYIFITHPEIIPGKTTIESAKALAVDKETWVSCKGYYLTPEQQAKLGDAREWHKDPLHENLLNVRELPEFYQSIAEFRGNKDYMPQAIEKCKVWASWIFGGGSREMWQYFGGVTPFDTWGSIDVDLLNRRVIAGMKTVTPCGDTDIVVHQNHDDPAINTITPRDMEKCMAALPRYASKSQALKPELLL